MGDVCAVPPYSEIIISHIEGPSTALGTVMNYVAITVAISFPPLFTKSKCQSLRTPRALATLLYITHHSIHQSETNSYEACWGERGFPLVAQQVETDNLSPKLLHDI